MQELFFIFILIRYSDAFASIIQLAQEVHFGKRFTLELDRTREARHFLFSTKYKWQKSNQWQEQPNPNPTLTIWLFSISQVSIDIDQSCTNPEAQAQLKLSQASSLHKDRSTYLKRSQGWWRVPWSRGHFFDGRSMSWPPPIPCPIQCRAISLLGDGSWEGQMGAR